MRTKTVTENGVEGEKAFNDNLSGMLLYKLKIPNRNRIHCFTEINYLLVIGARTEYEAVRILVAFYTL